MLPHEVLSYPLYKGLLLGFLGGFSFYALLDVLLSLPHYWWHWRYNRRVRKMMRERDFIED